MNGFEVTGIQKKVQLLLDSSGDKIKPLKRRRFFQREPEKWVRNTSISWTGIDSLMMNDFAAFRIREGNRPT